MEAVLDVAKAASNCLLSNAKSTIDAEVELRQGAQRDQVFLTEELAAMQAFLRAADEERNKHKVTGTSVKQVRDLAYDVEDCLQDFAIHLEKPSGWRLARTLLARYRIAEEMKGLRARVEDMAQRNSRYPLFEDLYSKPAISSERARIVNAEIEILGIDEPWRTRHGVDLIQLINSNHEELGVIAVWGTHGDLGVTSIIKNAYDHPDTHKKFQCQAWIRLSHPFNPTEFLQSIMRQFYADSVKTVGETQEKSTLGSQVLKKMGMMKQDDLVDDFNEHMNDRSYLIVLCDLSTMEDWDWIKTYFPDNKKGSRIIVSTAQVEVASLCTGSLSQVSELKQLSADQTVYAFYQKGSEDGTDSTETGSSLNATTGSSNSSAEGKSPTHIETTELIGRVNEKTEIINLISKHSQQLEVISVLGMGGLGKTTLVRDVYHSQELGSNFEKRACVTVMRPFNLQELHASLVMQLGSKTSGNKEATGLMVGRTRQEDQQSLADHLEGKKYLIVLDDVLSKKVWNDIVSHFPTTETGSRIIVTTRHESIAKHCSGKQENIYKLNHLGDKDAKDLFTKKVFIKETVDLDEQYPELAEEAKPILNKCRGLPLAIVTIAGFLANQPKTVVEWRKLNEHINAELEMNPELEPIKTVLEKSYNGLPFHLKSCFLYLSIFPEDQEVSRKRLVRRWTAEGYSREVHNKSAEEIADSYFMELMDRSMILPAQISIQNRKGMNSCQVHDLMHDIGLLKSKEENLVFRLEEGCNLNTQGTIRHLAIISSSWKGDKSEFDDMVDMSRIRSLTVFGEWRSFFISDKMRLLRVLDLEDAEEIYDHHLEHIGKLLHLRYLSLRGCGHIFHLPDSLGNLRQLETLDIRDTPIIKLPKSIIKLRKLNYLRAAHKPAGEGNSYEEFTEGFPKLMRNRLCLLILGSVGLCSVCSAAPVVDFGGMSSRDIRILGSCFLLPAVAMRLDMFGVLVPRGMNRLKALHTLGVINVGRGKAVLQEIQSLARLRKLGVTGVNKKSGGEFCAVLAALRRLKSLSVRSEGEPGLSGCLDGMSSPPKKLQGLKLYGNLVKLPEWIQGLKNLVKLKLRSTRLSEHDVAMQVLGNLPSLAILRLWSKSFQADVLRFPNKGFRSLEMLHLELRDIKSVRFDKGAMPKLELLHVWDFRENDIDFSGLEFLPSIKEVRLNVRFASNFDRRKTPEERLEEARKEAKLKQDKLNNHARDLLAKNPRQPILKVD